jgi:uncharacterized membrane protein YraQ (UPF0718 family)
VDVTSGTIPSPPPELARPAPVRELPLWAVATALWVLVVGVMAAREGGLSGVPAFATFGVIFASIVVEALPFILLGAVVSAAMAVWVPDRAFRRVGRLPRALQLPGAAVAGVAFPVCECGSVPVARRLISRGVHPSAGIAFMLSAPILNPIVIASTWTAFGGGARGWELVGGRCLLGLIIAMVAGLVVGRRAEGLLREVDPVGAAHDHEHGAGGMRAFCEHVVGDFVFMGRFLVLGAALSALVQTVVPQTVLAGVAGTAVLGILAMMALAFALSLCSQADAFVATSFSAFSPGAQLAFLVLGPMADTKLTVLYGATFRRAFVLRLLAVAVPLCLAGGLLLDALVT